MFTISPLWIGETCRPELRGFFLCFFNTSIVFGQLAMSVSNLVAPEILLTSSPVLRCPGEAAISPGSGRFRHLLFHIRDHSSNIECINRQWWLPIVGMYIFPGKMNLKYMFQPLISPFFRGPVIMLSGWPFFPESPHWLLRQGKRAQAYAALQRVYGIKSETFYTIELHRMESENLQVMSSQDTLAQDRRVHLLGLDLSSEADCFRASNRKRTLTAIFAMSGQQMIGATFVIGYATYFLDQIGVKDYFDASIVLYIMMLLASILAFPLSEIIGRRTMIVGPQFFLCFMLLFIGILGCVPDQEKASLGIIVFIYIWAIIYQLSIGAMGFVLASEIATARLRSTTQGFVTITNAIWGIIMHFTIPYMVCSVRTSIGIDDFLKFSTRSILMQEI